MKTVDFKIDKNRTGLCKSMEKEDFEECRDKLSKAGETPKLNQPMAAGQFSRPEAGSSKPRQSTASCRLSPARPYSAAPLPTAVPARPAGDDQTDGQFVTAG